MKKNVEQYKKMAYREMGINVLFIILGIILVIKPKMLNKTACIFIGILLLLVGANALYKHMLKAKVSLFHYSLVFSILSFLIGAIMLINPFDYVFLVTQATAVYFILRGLLKLEYAICLLRAKEGAYLVLLVSSIFLILLAISMIIDPFVTTTLSVLTGAFLILYGILDLSDLHLLLKRSERIVKELK